MKRLLLILAAAIVAFAVSAVPAMGQKVGNPGSFSAKLVSGQMKVKNNEFGFDESQNINFSGTIDKAGSVNIPSIVFPDSQLDSPVGAVTVKINVVNPTTGTLNPITGAVSLRLKVWIKIDGVPFGGGCRVGSASSPIDINTLITGTTSPPGPNTPISGIPYNPANGTVQIVNNSFGVPASSDCGPGASAVNDLVNSPAGNNRAAFDLRFTPVLTKGINPVINAAPSSGTAPFQTTLSAAGTTAPAGVASYQWDFDGNGSFDQTTTTASTTNTYTTGGTFNARVRVTDNDGDSADATRAVTVAAFPDLSVSATHGTFRVGSPGTYRIAVKNDGYAATTGPATVRATLPEGLTYTGVAGSGWTCAPDGSDILCSRTASIARGASAPDLELTVNVGPAALGTVTPVFRVATTGDNGPGNDSVSDPTEVAGLDLEIDKSHTAHGMRPGSDPANRFSIAVRNRGSAPTIGTVTVTDVLPAGLTFAGATGNGWACGETAGTVTCTRSGTLEAGASAPEIELAVTGSLPEGSTGTKVVNEASVSTPSDVNPANDTDSDPTLILDGPDLTIDKSHEANFVAGGQETYRLAVRNDGPRPTTGATTITDELPAGLSFVSATGDGWQCNSVDGTVECTRSAEIAAEAAAPPVELVVTVGEAAIPEVTNGASVATPGDGNPDNDADEDPTLVRAIDLLIEKSHEGVFRTNRPGTYRLDVSNVGDSATVAPAVVTDVLPASLDFVSAAGGSAWDCDEASGTVTCSHDGEIAAGESAAPIELRVDVSAAAAPSVANTATVATVDDFSQVNDSSEDTANVVDLDAAVKIARTGTFEIGKRGTYLISVDNLGSAPTTGPLTTTIALPAGVTAVSASGAGWTCPLGGATITCTRPATLPAETPAADIALRVLVTESAASPLQATATVATAGDRNPLNDDDADEAEIATPDLGLSAAHSGPLRVGSVSAYSYAIENEGGGSTTGPVTFTTELPDGVTLAGTTGTGWVCDATAGQVECELSRLLTPGSSAPALTLQVLPSAAALPAGENTGSVENRAAIDAAGDAVPGNDESVVNTELIAVDLAITATGDEALNGGDSGSYEIRLENQGSAVTAGAVHLRGELPAGLTGTSIGGQGWTCSFTGNVFACRTAGTIAPGAQPAPVELDFRSASATTGELTTELALEAAGDVDPLNDETSISTGFTSGPDLAVDLVSRPASGFRAGTPGVLKATVRNAGTAATGHESVLTVIPAEGLTFESAAGTGWACTGEGTITCVHTAPIAAGALSRVDLTFVAARPTGSGSVSAATAFTVGDTEPANDRAELETPVSWIDVGITRSHEGEWAAGTKGAYTVKVQNSGTGATTGTIEVAETLPAGTTFASAAGDGWDCVATGRDLECERGETLAAGAAAAFRVTLDIAPDAPAELNATSKASTTGDLNPGNDSVNEKIAVKPVPPVVEEEEKRVLPASIGTGTVRMLKDGTLRVRLGCPAEATEKCRGTLNLASASKVKVPGKKKRAKRVAKTILPFGQATYAVAAGRTAPVTVSVPKKTRAALKNLKKVSVRVTASATGLAPVTALITVKAP